VQPENPADLNFLIAKYGIHHPASDPSGTMKDDTDLYRAVEAIRNGDKNLKREFDLLVLISRVGVLEADFTEKEKSEIMRLLFMPWITRLLQWRDERGVRQEVMDHLSANAFTGKEKDLFQKLQLAVDLADEGNGIFPHNCKSPGLALMANIKKVSEQFDMPPLTAQDCLSFFELAEIEERDLKTIRDIAKQVGLKLAAGKKGRPPKK